MQVGIGAEVIAVIDCQMMRRSSGPVEVGGS